MNIGKFKKFVFNQLESSDIIASYIWHLKIHKKLWPGTWDLTSLVLKKTIDENLNDKFQVKEYLDIGCGHVALFGRYIKKKYSSIKVTSSDLYQNVCDCAKFNIEKNNLDISLIQSDLFKGINKKYDLITANLPYVSTKFKHNIPEDTVRFNSRYSGDKGTELTEKFLKEAKNYLNPNGKIFLGVNCYYIPENICLKLIKEYGYKLDKVIKKKFNTAVVFIIS